MIPTYVDVRAADGWHYYPITIGQYALAIFHTWLSSARAHFDQQRFLRIADWLLEHQAEDGCWYAQTDVPTYRLSAPWPSAMAPGRGLSVLTRAWQCTSDKKYIQGARRALAAFSVPIEWDGITDTFDGRVTFEEYPAKPAPHVLNGMIFALFGVWDMVRAQPDDAHAAMIFEHGAATVEALLPLYDAGWWSLYDLYHLEIAKSPRNPCTAHYHDIHVKQLRVMHAITGIEKRSARSPAAGPVIRTGHAGAFVLTPARPRLSRGTSWAERPVRSQVTDCLRQPEPGFPWRSPFGRRAAAARHAAVAPLRRSLKTAGASDVNCLAYALVCIGFSNTITYSDV